MQKVELTRMDTVANFYFDFLDAERRCFEIKGYREFEVGDLKSTPVRVYNYYSKGELAADHDITFHHFYHILYFHTEEYAVFFYDPLIGPSCL